MDSTHEMAYQSAITRAEKEIKAQLEWLNRIGISEQKAVKMKVQDYFRSILCDFDEKLFNKLYK
jgi:hypothetical protein